MTDILVKIKNNHSLQQFLHECVDNLVTPNRKSFGQNRDLDLSDQDIHTATIFIQSLYRENVQQEETFDTTKIQDLNEEMQKLVINCYEIRKEEIAQVAIKSFLIENGKPVVENIDWKLKWLMGSSKLSNLRQPVLQLDLHCLKQEGANTRKCVNFEMNVDQVDELLLALQNGINNLQSN